MHGVMSLITPEGEVSTATSEKTTDTKQGTTIQSITNSTLYNMWYKHNCACVPTRDSKYLMHYIMDKSHKII